MILEALEYLTTPCPAWARSLGYLGEAIAIRHRARRCADDWRDHQNNTKQAILAASKQFGAGGKTVLLGAGLCLDVPLTDLAARCDSITLVDACRLRGLRLPVNADYQCFDIHGGAEALYQGRRITERQGSPIAQFGDADLVISVNLISQLPILPLRHAGLPADAGAEIMQDHIRDLSDLDCPALLIGDAERRIIDPAGEIIEIQDLRHDMGLPPPEQSWVWPIVPAREAGKAPRVESTVGMWIL